jgi:hypothetical protein
MLANSGLLDGIYGVFPDGAMVFSPWPNVMSLGAAIRILSSSASLNEARTTFRETLEDELGRLAAESRSQQPGNVSSVFLFDSVCLTCPSGIELETILTRSEATGTNVLLLVPGEYAALIHDLQKKKGVHVRAFRADGNIGSLVIDAKILGLRFPFMLPQSTVSPPLGSRNATSRP